MRTTSVWQEILAVPDTVIEGVDFDEVGEAVIVMVRPRAKVSSRCGVCGGKAPGYDQGDGRPRRWRGLDLGSTMVFLEATVPRVACPTHGVTTAGVPWARHRSRFTIGFEDTTAWLAVHTAKAVVSTYLRVVWRTVGAIVTRVQAELTASGDPLAGLTRIGIDEIAYKRNHLYLIVVVDHDTGHLVWAAPGRDEATLATFFAQLGPERCARITQVSADAARWIATAVARHCPQARQCADPFHVVAWAMEALDLVRRDRWNELRDRTPIRPGTRRRATGGARSLKHARFALWKNPEHLTPKQRAQLAWIAKADPMLHRAYLLKEGLRLVFTVKGETGKQMLDDWIQWARRCRIPAFVELQRRITKHRATIDAALDTGLSNALIESTNTKIRLLTRIAFGFHDPQALVALALLKLGPYQPALPGRD